MGDDGAALPTPGFVFRPPEGGFRAGRDDLFLLLDKLQAVKVQGRDRGGRKIVRIVGKFFPARAAKEGVVRKYLEERIFPQLMGEGKAIAPFCVVYLHTGAERTENFPGVSALRSIYESLPDEIRERLESVYFVHPSLQSRLFLATLGRFLFSSGLYRKVRYVSRLEFLWKHVKRAEVEIPDLVRDHDAELERRPLMDYGIEVVHHRVYEAAAMDSAASMYSLRCNS